jgi:hypothetical protein
MPARGTSLSIRVDIEEESYQCIRSLRIGLRRERSMVGERGESRRHLSVAWLAMGDRRVGSEQELPTAFRVELQSVREEA